MYQGQYLMAMAGARAAVAQGRQAGHDHRPPLLGLDVLDVQLWILGAKLNKMILQKKPGVSAFLVATSFMVTTSALLAPYSSNKSSSSSLAKIFLRNFFGVSMSKASESRLKYIGVFDMAVTGQI